MPLSNNCLDIHNEFDYFFWMGDLNYRIEWDRDKIIEQTEHQKYDEMMLRDQLMNEMNVWFLFFFKFKKTID